MAKKPFKFFKPFAAKQDKEDKLEKGKEGTKKDIKEDLKEGVEEGAPKMMARGGKVKKFAEGGKVVRGGGAAVKGTKFSFNGGPDV
jgi:hypothetical protein